MTMIAFKYVEADDGLAQSRLCLLNWCRALACSALQTAKTVLNVGIHVINLMGEGEAAILM